MVGKPTFKAYDDHILPLTIKTPRRLQREIAGRAKLLRLEREWTQAELAERANIALSTYRRFERSGEISLERLLKVALVFNALSQFEKLFEVPPRTLDDLERRSTRQRGKRSDAET